MSVTKFKARAGAALIVASLGLAPGLPWAQQLAEDEGSGAAPPISQALLPALMIANAEKGLLLGVGRAGSTLVAVGGNGVIIRSNDGESWSQVKSPVDVALTGIAFASASNGWAVGHDALVLATLDGGLTWKIQNFQPALNAPLFAIQPLSLRRAIAVGAFGALKITEDGGATWSDAVAPEVNGESLHLNAVTRLRDGKLVLVGERGLLGISDDGRQWRRLVSPYEGSFFGVLPWGPRGALAFGMRGNVYVSDDAGHQAWRKLEVGTTASFFGGQVLGGGRVILTGAEAKVLLIDSNSNVQQLDTASLNNGQPSTLTGVASLGDRLVLVGESGAKLLSAPRP